MPRRKTSGKSADQLKGRQVVVGVSGGIAAYKAADLVSKLRQRGVSVTVVMTEAAQKFVTPLTFESLSDNRVIIDLFSDRSPYVMGHIALSDWAQAVVIAPATANIIGKLAAGIADDALTTVAISVKCPVFLAPAMNDAMFANPIVQANLKRLEEVGWRIIEPAEGWLACGRVGKGRMCEVREIVSALEALFR